MILSNVDNASFAHSHAGLGVEFDIYTAEMSEATSLTMRISPICWTSSHHAASRRTTSCTRRACFTTMRPANRHGLRNCWIIAGMRMRVWRHDESGDMPSYDFRFNSMADMVEAHRAELAGLTPNA